MLNKIVFSLVGLDCVSCANKIEEKVNDLSDVKVANLDFVNRTLMIEYNNGASTDFVNEKAKEIILSLEPHVKIFKREEFKAKENIGEEGQIWGLDKWYVVRLFLGIIVFGGAVLLKNSISFDLILFVVAYFLIGGDVVKKALNNIFRGRIFDEYFLMSLATISAFLIGEHSEAVAVMLFYQLGETLQAKVVNKSRKSIASLLNIRPEYANLVVGFETKVVLPDEVNINDIIVVKPGERVPLDGIIIEGNSNFDTSNLTGESIPRFAKAKDQVLSGFININGLVKIKVQKRYEDSTVAKILDLVENASSKKAPTERFITKFSRYYTPFVVFSAISIVVFPMIFIDGAVLNDWVYRALIFLVVSCPCALVLSIPIGYFGGLGNASKHGILIKGSNYLEGLNDVETVVLDKTGTLTKGTFEVTKVQPYDERYNEEQILEIAALVESFSNHPIAKSIMKAYGKSIAYNTIEDYHEEAGMGVSAVVDSNKILVGNKHYMNLKNIDIFDEEIIGTVVYVSFNNNAVGYILIEDEVKLDSKKTIQALKELGIKKVLMLTGDSENVAREISEKLGIDGYSAELLPHEKVSRFEDIELNKGVGKKVVFIGDGVNDAPVIARADIGIAMGALGSDVAIEAADIVFMTDEPYKIIESLRIAKKTKKIIWQNIIFALAIKGLVLSMGAFGLATMWEAVFADVGVAVISVLNASRVQG